MSQSGPLLPKSIHIINLTTSSPSHSFALIIRLAPSPLPYTPLHDPSDPISHPALLYPTVLIDKSAEWEGDGFLSPTEERLVRVGRATVDDRYRVFGRAVGGEEG
jgi:hypothetical protein